MPVKPVPEGFHTVTPFLMVDDADQLLAFLEKAFDAKVTSKLMHSSGKIAHAQLRIGDSMVLLGDVMGEHEPMKCCLYLYVTDVDAMYRKAMAAGAQSIMEPADRFYGDRSGGVIDPMGNAWWLGTHIEDVPQEELERRSLEEESKAAGKKSAA